MKSRLPVLGAIIVLTIAAYARWTPPSRADAAMHALLATGRPVYVSGLLGNQVPWFRAFLQMLNLRFTTTRVATVSGVELYRVGELGGHSPRL